MVLETYMPKEILSLLVLTPVAYVLFSSGLVVILHHSGATVDGQNPAYATYT